MKRFIIFAIYALVASFYCYSTPPTTIYPGLTLYEDNGKYYIHFELHDYQIKTDTFVVTNSTPVSPSIMGHAPGQYYFSRIEPYGHDYYDYLSEAGRPELPFYSLDLLLPPDGGQPTITNIQTLSTSVTLSHDYTPSQASNYSFEDFAYDAAYYTTYNTTWYWNDCAIDTFQYRHMKGFNFSIYPFHYEPSTQSLKIITEATFEITYKGTPLSTSYLGTLLGMDRSIYYFFDNYIGYPAPYEFINDDYLIITADNKLAATQSITDFITHKESLGYNVTITSLDEIGYEPKEIRDHIQTLFKESDLKYVLLVGDVDVLPFYDGIESDDTDPPSDTYYACLSKDDANDQWKDLSPSVFIGRWPIQDTVQLRHIVDKTIASDLHLGEYHPDEINIFSGSGNHNYLSSKYIYDHIVQQYSYYTGSFITGSQTHSAAFDTMRILLQDNNDNPTLMFVYVGGGHYDQIGDPYGFDYIHIDTTYTSTLDFQPFGFGFADELGNIFKPNNFARKWLTSTEGGITFLGATTISYVTADRYFSRKMFNQLEGHPLMTIGEFVGNAKAKYYNCDQVVWRRREAKKYVLYGDPSLYLFGLHYNQPYSAPQRSQNSGNELIEKDITSIQVYSVTGKLLRISHATEPDLQGLPTGTYMVVYNSGDDIITKKIVVQ